MNGNEWIDSLCTFFNTVFSREGIVALAAVASACFTGTIFIINCRQLKHAREVDRGYVSGGGPGSPPSGPFSLQINNYGRTPITLVAYAVEFCELSAIPTEPAYLAHSYKRTICGSVQVYGPNAHACEVNRFEYKDKGLRDPVVYGRFWYKDIWGQSHYSSFILRLPPGEFPENPSAAYTEWT